MTQINHVETLHVIAQIAITLIGFTAIAIALREREAGEWSPVNEMQLFSIITPPTAALICCFVPELVAMLMKDEEAIWKLSNLILALAKLGVWLGFSLFLTRWRELHTIQWVMLTGGMIFIIVNFLAAFGALPWLEFLYIIGILWPLVVGIQNFVALIGIRSGS